MSPKAKLTLVLCATTAIFTFNPNVVSHLLHVDDKVAAGELTLEPGAVDGLKALTSTANTTAVDSTLSNNGGVLAPRDFSGLSPNNAEPAASETTDVAPGENPFSTNGQTTSVNRQVNTVTDPNLNPVANPAVKSAVLPGSFAIKGGQQTTPANTVANPFLPAGQQEQKVALPVDPSQTKPRVDDSALRYYAATKDLKRLGAEMRRLKTLYPDWQPPKDLFSPVASVSEQPLWEIYKTGNYAAVRAQIAQMQSTNPRWQPSDDLLYKLQLGETRSMIYRAYAQKRWNAVISVAQSYPPILVCTDMQVLWNVGESFAQMKDYAQSFDLYKYVLTNCDDPASRLATVQKASLVLPAKGITSLISLGKVMPDGSQEFENIGFDGVRRQIGEYIKDGDMAAAPTDEDLKRFVDFIQRTSSVNDAELMGWFFYTQQDWQLANSWFIQATQYQRTPKNIEGVILTLRNMERGDDALKVARRYLKASPEVAEQYIEIISESLTSKTPTVTLKDKELDDFEKIVVGNKSPLGAQALGWKYLSSGDKDKAKDWFTQSVGWKPTEGGVVGLAVLASRDKDYRVLSALKSEYRKDYASLDDFKIYTARKVYKVKKFKRSAYRDADNFVPKKKRNWQFQAPG
jgi:hypothetical protein